MSYTPLPYDSNLNAYMQQQQAAANRSMPYGAGGVGSGGIFPTQSSSSAAAAMRVPSTPPPLHSTVGGTALPAPQIHLTEQGYGYYALGPNGQPVFVPTNAPQQQQAAVAASSSSVYGGLNATNNNAGVLSFNNVNNANNNNTTTTNVLAQLEREFRDIEEKDPSLADGFRVVYDREVPFELRPADSRDHDVGALEGIKVKILTQGDGGDGTAAVSAVRVELTSEADLFFHYTCLINAVGFMQLREDQKLMCEFKDFVVTLLKMCNRCIREPNNFLAVLLLNTDGSASLEFIQNVEYKFIDLLVLPFRESPDHIVRADITYRYNAVRSRLSIMTGKLQDVTALVKVRQ